MEVNEPEVEDRHQKLVDSIALRIQKEPSSSSMCSIYKVPDFLRKPNESAFRPYTISIGPRYWGEPELQKMEEHKTRYMMSFLNLENVIPEATAERCKEILSPFIHQFSSVNPSDFYEKEIISHNKKVENKSLEEILLVDGCFILELFIRFLDLLHGRPHRRDPIFKSSWMIVALQRDLLLLENQIPFLYLEELYKYVKNHVSDYYEGASLSKFALQFFVSCISYNVIAKERSGICTDVKHLLDLVHKWSSPQYVERFPNFSPGYIRNATKLEAAGITFKKGISEHLFDIKYKKGILHIPQLYVDDNTETLFRNLIALEQCSSESEQHFTSYAMLMDHLIDTVQDAEILENKSIIVNYLGCTEDIPKLFNNLCKEVVPTYDIF